MTNIIIAGFAVGFLGSFHCMGMCGGLVASLSSTRRNVWWFGLAAYQAGRIVTYTFLGMLTGLVGIAMTRLLWFDHLQNMLAIAAGTIMLIFGMHIAGWMPDPFSKGVARFYHVTGLSQWIASARNSHMPTSWFMVGMINGLLPCGLVYAGLSLSLTAVNVGNSMLIMFAFGLGTVPAMMIFPGLLSKVSVRGRVFSIKLAAMLVICLGLITMFRGTDWFHNHQHMSHEQHMATNHIHQK